MEKQIVIVTRKADEEIPQSDKKWYTFLSNFFSENKRIFNYIFVFLIFSGTIVFFVFSFLYGNSIVGELSFCLAHDKKQMDQSIVDTNALFTEQNKLRTEIATLEKLLDKKTPRSVYLVVNTSKNKFTLYKYKEPIGKGKCSTGSYILLSNGDEQQWIFKTPKGVFDIKGKMTDPVWVKPDWAFIEEGLPIPSATHSSRYEYGVLGDYALSLGHGYLIHGTLYQRFLGLPVTHGCIRLNDDDLKLVYQRLAVGSKVFIY